MARGPAARAQDALHGVRDVPAVSHSYPFFARDSWRPAGAGSSSARARRAVRPGRPRRRETGRSAAATGCGPRLRAARDALGRRVLRRGAVSAADPDRRSSRLRARCRVDDGASARARGHLLARCRRAGVRSTLFVVLADRTRRRPRRRAGAHGPARDSGGSATPKASVDDRARRDTTMPDIVHLRAGQIYEMRNQPGPAP